MTKNVQSKVMKQLSCYLRTLFFGIILGLLISYLLPNLYAYERPQAISLSGEWQFAPTEPLVSDFSPSSGSFDPPEFSPAPEEVIPPTVRKQPENFLPDPTTWIQVTVPSAWEQILSIDYNKAGWYRRDVIFPDSWLDGKQKIWIEFDAVATAAGIWLNGKWLGGHVGDYARWRVDASIAVRTGKNDLLIFVDELPGHITQGFLSVIAPHHGGIWQEVRCYTGHPASLIPDGIWVKTNNKNGDFRVEIQVEKEWQKNWKLPKIDIRGYPSDRSSENIEPFLTIHQPDSSPLHNTTLFYSGQIEKYKLWSPENPVLYQLEIEFYGENPDQPIEKVNQTFAFRDIRIEGSTVLLNGKKLNIRSVLNWGYYPGIVSPAPPSDLLRSEFEYYRSLGFNAETICLMNMPDYFYDLADETGMLIWEAYPTWHNEFTEKELPEYRRLFPSFFRRDRNHPSIILRSISVEAGVKNQNVMGELVEIAKEMTDTPVQDNSSWFWLSNEKLTDWYGEDNYWNNDRWARHMLIDLPSRLDEKPIKPYIIGESMAGSMWPDTKSLMEFKTEKPYWFPSAFESCIAIERELRERYQPLLPDNMDIIRDYLLPQSYEYSRLFRKFQIQLLYADPRYAGWTVYLGRDVPNCPSGLHDFIGRPRWTASDWEWLSGATTAPVTAEQVSSRKNHNSIIHLAPELKFWTEEWGLQLKKNVAVYILQGGYSDLNGIFAEWPNAVEIKEDKINSVSLKAVIVSTVLTENIVQFMVDGGRVFILTSRWPGALGGERNMYWADAVFVPPAGPLSPENRDRLLKLQMFDLTHTKSEVIPVEELGIHSRVDPLIRLFEIHGRETIQIHDQLFATKVGKGLLVASSLDHSAEAGQWLLGELITWQNNWKPTGERDFPVTSISVEEIERFAVPRTNSIVMLQEDWYFKTDPDRVGEKLNWAGTGLEVSNWDTLQAGRMWENQGYSYDGMAWYRKSVMIPMEWKKGRVYLVAEGVDDAYRLWINGKAAAFYGSFTEHEQTVYLTKTETDITKHLKYGENNLIVLQVVDVFGGGGITQPIYLRVE
ncbi:MAG: hypothetical protein EH225_06220 [Calditrichaeota bacterium]|nr:hypothetical protein [Calditrichota bacterium]RQW04102.1 MAG: hypothetical protein EH225_06220 [Calditrichota bacterium]